jgi:CheY-like chemotaxis protein
MLRRLIGENIQLITDLDPDLSLVRADPGQIHQVLLNLVVNARDAMPSGGRLSIETRNVDLPEKPKGDEDPESSRAHVKLSVRDSGVGMSEETKRKIFEPFFTTKSLGEGTGLGLAVVHGIVEQSDGHIEVRSAPGAGTTFDVILPSLTDPSETDPGIHLSEPAPIGTETILLVEDEASVRRLAEEILKELGYHVLAAADGETALKICAQPMVKVDLLVTDVVMPGMGGHAVANKICEMLPDTRVLFLSGYPDNDVVRHGILHDKVNFLQKPFSADALARKVREALKSHERRP